MTHPRHAPDHDALLEHAGFVRALARSLVLDGHAADDVVQETWLAALRSGPRHSKNLRGWLGVVARNLVFRSARGAKRRAVHEGRVARPDRFPSTADLALRMETQRRILGAVQDLEEPYRAAIIHRYLDDRSPAEIAAHLDVPVKTVRSRLHRALQMLRARLDREHGGDRRAWMIALFPLLKPPPAAAAAIGGALVMKKVAALTVIAAVIVTGFVVWRTGAAPRAEGPRGERAEAAALPERAAAPAAPEAAPPMETPGQPAAADEGICVGRVSLENGTPLRDVVFSVGNDPKLRGTTDAEGRLHVAGEWKGAKELLVHAADNSWMLTTGAFATAGTEVEAVLDAGVILTTTVVAQDGGAPVPKARLYMGRSDLATTPGQGQGVWAHGDEDGRVRVEFLPAALYRFEVKAPAFEARQGTIDLARETFPDRVELLPGRRLPVRLLGLAPGFDGKEVRGFVQQWGGGPPAWFREKLDGRGGFEIPAPPPGEHGLVVEAGELTPRLTAHLVITEEDPEPVVLQVPAGAAWSGFVRRADGQPLAGATIRIDNDGTSLRTDDRGFARAAALKPGEKKVVMMIPDGWISIGLLEIPESGMVQKDLTLPGSSGVRFRIVPPRRMGVVLQHETHPELYGYQISGTDGWIRMDHLAAGPYKIETRGEFVANLGKVVLREGEVLEHGAVDLGASASVAVELEVPEGVKMPRGISIIATVGSEEQVALVFVDASGRGVAKGLPEGTHVVRATTPGFVEQELKITVPSATPLRILLDPLPPR